MKDQAAQPALPEDSMTPSEIDLIQRFQSGETAGFDGVYDCCAPAVYRFCRRLTRSVADAEDLTQEVFVAAYSGRERFGGRSSLVTWLLRIAVFRSRAICRRRRVDTVPIVDGGGVSTPDPATREVTRIALARALEQLPPDQREAFVLVRAEGLTCREAAEVLGIPEGTLKFRVQRAAARLQSILIDAPAEIAREGGSHNEAC